MRGCMPLSLRVRGRQFDCEVICRYPLGSGGASVIEGCMPLSLRVRGRQSDFEVICHYPLGSGSVSRIEGVYAIIPSRQGQQTHFEVICHYPLGSGGASRIEGLHAIIPSSQALIPRLILSSRTPHIRMGRGLVGGQRDLSAAGNSFFTSKIFGNRN